MKPYYEQDGITIYHGDCREILPSLDVDADMVFADPPYNVGLKYTDATDDNKSADAYLDWCREWFAECRRLAAVTVITPGMVSVPMWIADIERTHFLVAWTKANNNSRNYLGKTSGYQCWEPILAYGKARSTILRDWIDQPISLQPEIGGHPCPKPLKLLRRLVGDFSTDGSLVIDPFVGSGTTLRAAKDLGRTAIGIDVEESYCEIAAKRLAQGVLDFGALRTTGKEG